MTLRLRLDGTEPLYRQIYSRLRRAIEAGRLSAGELLPSSRALAATLSVSRNVVLIAYAQLEAEGYVRGRTGAGTYVSRGLPQPPTHRARLRGSAPSDAQPRRLSAFGKRLLNEARAWNDEPRTPARWDFTVGMLASEDFPDRDWQRSLRDAARVSRTVYGPSEGVDELRREILRYLTISRGVTADPEQVVVTTGVRQGYDLTLRLLVDRGGGVVLENPGFPPAAAWTRAHGATPIPLPVDRDGIQPEPLTRIRAGQLAYLTPSHQYPTGAILSLPRRRAVLEWATKSGCAIFEDDYDAEFQYAVRPIPALQGLAPRAVVYAGSMAKVLSPALRIGFLIVPSDLVDAFRAAKRGSDRQTSALLQRTVANFMADGSFTRHLRRQRVRYRARRAALVDAITAELGAWAAVDGAEAGLQLLVTLRDVPVAREAELVRSAAALGVRVEGAASCFSAPPPNAALLLGFAAMPEASIPEGIHRLARVVRDVRRAAPGGGTRRSSGRTG
jgi:GntR family transcriptional regulator/MocR family aminotransferase